MQQLSDDLVELGSISDDTAGDWGPPFEPAGRMLRPGLAQD